MNYIFTYRIRWPRRSLQKMCFAFIHIFNSVSDGAFIYWQNNTFYNITIHERQNNNKHTNVRTIQCQNIYIAVYFKRIGERNHLCFYDTHAGVCAVHYDRIQLFVLLRYMRSIEVLIKSN